jgi:hypothetical protein
MKGSNHESGMEVIITRVLGCFTLNGYAYQFTDDFADGFYWGSTPLTFAIAEPDAMKGQLLQQLVNQAVNAWEDGLGQNLWNIDASILPGVVAGRNLIRWSNNLEAETGFADSSTLAVTLRYIQGPYYIKSEIILNANHYALNNLNTLKWTLVHELGHTYGLGHSNNLSAVMYYQYVGSTGLSSDDITGLNELLYETQRRQTINYISPLAFDDTRNANALSCATVDLGNGSSGGPFGGLFSLIIGVLLTLVLGRFGRKTLPVPVR